MKMDIKSNSILLAGRYAPYASLQDASPRRRYYAIDYDHNMVRKFIKK